MYYPEGMKARVGPVQWSKPNSILASTQDSNPGGRIQNHKRWPLHYHCTYYAISIYRLLQYCGVPQGSLVSLLALSSLRSITYLYADLTQLWISFTPSSSTSSFEIRSPHYLTYFLDEQTAHQPFQNWISFYSHRQRLKIIISSVHLKAMMPSKLVLLLVILASFFYSDVIIFHTQTKLTLSKSCYFHVNIP